VWPLRLAASAAVDGANIARQNGINSAHFIPDHPVRTEDVSFPTAGSITPKLLNILEFEG
ncbi:MAG: hypothetical protein ABJC40_02620, partial [Parasphingorhabdus sp.]